MRSSQLNRHVVTPISTRKHHGLLDFLPSLSLLLARLLVLLAVVVVFQRYFSPSMLESSALLFGIGVYY